MSNLYGQSTYGSTIYSETPERYTFTGLLDYDFEITWLNKKTSSGISGVEWELYKRDYLLDINSPVDENHILIDSGITDKYLRISLADYGGFSRSTRDDYFIMTHKNGNYFNHRSRFYVQYFPQLYAREGRPTPYFASEVRVTKYIPRDTSSGNPDKVIYKDIIWPVVLVRRILTKDEEDIDVILIEIK